VRAGETRCSEETPPLAMDHHFGKAGPITFGFGQGLFVNKGDVIVLSEFFVDSVALANTLGNGSDPFSNAPPTLSGGGIQGPTVLQPVLEFNGLMPGWLHECRPQLELLSSRHGPETSLCRPLLAQH